MGAASSLMIGGGESGGAGGEFGGSERRLNGRSVEEILGFGARGGLDLGRRSSSGEEEEGGGD